jgi:hypothetical protein
LPTITIPDSYKAGINQLAHLAEGDVDRLLAGFNRIEPKLTGKELAADLQSQIEGPQIAQLSEIVESLVGVSSLVGAYEELPLDKIVQDLLDAMQQHREDFAEPASGWKPFGAVLTRLLQSSSLRISARANDVQHEEPKLFANGRILTDIRPVFEGDEAELKGALIIHSMKLTYFSDGEYKDFYVALDDNDLRALRKVLERAERKSAVLKATLSKAAITYF